MYETEMGKTIQAEDTKADFVRKKRWPDVGSDIDILTGNHL